MPGRFQRNVRSRPGNFSGKGRGDEDFAEAEKNKLVEKREAAARKWFQEHDLPYKNQNARKGLPDEEKHHDTLGSITSNKGS